MKGGGVLRAINVFYMTSSWQSVAGAAKECQYLNQL